ncbi:ap endonuclease [Anaeramoeba flamelloides]|uniref:Ap endonuclease n=1 Tax=Anaeramoeba flamelloides TaxID=1746091 RepID=A0AAV7Z9G5_9EUKA|nr:ap endonuclease [Anaeramoeba flamelloides]
MTIHIINNKKYIIQKFNGKKRLKKGINNKILNFKLIFSSFNIRGLNKFDKKKLLESFLINNDIDICFLQETKTKNKPNLTFYYSVIKNSYGEKKAKGGLQILFKKSYEKFISEIQYPDQDIQIISFTDIIFINLYFREDRKNEFGKIIQKLVVQYHNFKTVILGDFNHSEMEIMKNFQLKNFKIIPNTSNSRTNNIDHILINFKNNFILKNSKTIQNSLSDHKMLINNLALKTDWNIKKIYRISNQNTYQKLFTNYFSEKNFLLDITTIKNFKNKFIQFKDIIYKEEKTDYEIAPLIKNLLSNPNLIHRIKKNK